MNEQYSNDIITIAKKLLESYEYIGALHQFMKETEIPYKEADNILRSVQKEME